MNLVSHLKVFHSEDQYLVVPKHIGRHKGPMMIGKEGFSKVKQAIDIQRCF